MAGSKLSHGEVTDIPVRMASASMGPSDNDFLPVALRLPCLVNRFSGILRDTMVIEQILVSIKWINY
jgi:hypothetical protein